MAQYHSWFTVRSGFSKDMRVHTAAVIPPDIGDISTSLYIIRVVIKILKNCVPLITWYGHRGLGAYAWHMASALGYVSHIVCRVGNGRASAPPSHFFLGHVVGEKTRALHNILHILT